MATKLFVGGLAYAITSDQLRELFEAVGTVVSADVIEDKYTKQSKGFGFVQMGSEEEAQRAVKELDGKEVQGRNIAVSEARPQERRERPPFRDRNGGGGFDNDRRGRDDRRDGGRRY